MIQFLLIFLLFSGAVSADAKLQSSINITSTRPGKINPSTPVILSTRVKNIGDEKSLPGEIFIRFAFREPHTEEANSVLFETEKVDLPALSAGEEKTITFKTPHLLPTIFEFVRHDWAMRDYEAVVERGGKKEVIGKRALGFTAHYYEGCE